MLRGVGAVGQGLDVDVGFTEDHEEVAFAGVLQVAGHVEVGVHAGLEDGDAAEFGELGRVGVVVEGAGDEDVESGVTGFAGGGDKIGAGDGAEFGADQDGGAFFLSGFDVAAFGADQISRPWRDGRERDLVLFVRLLNA
jgi:hypothetical protein